MELVYLWVEEYKNIKNQGFNFSPRFTCKYEDGELTIDKKEHVSIFPDNINITAIVGENGSGKSSIVEILEHIDSYTGELYLKYRKSFIFLFALDDKPTLKLITNIDELNQNNLYEIIKVKPIQENVNSFPQAERVYIDSTKKALGKVSYRNPSTFELYFSFLTLFSEMPYPFVDTRKLKILRGKTINYENSNIANILIHNANKDYSFELTSFMLYPKIIWLYDNEDFKTKILLNIKEIKVGSPINCPNQERKEKLNPNNSLEAYMIEIIINSDLCEEFFTKYKNHDDEKVIQEYFSKHELKLAYNLIEYEKLISSQNVDLENINEEKRNLIEKYKQFLNFDFEDKEGRKISDFSHGERTLFSQFVSIVDYVKKAKNILLAFDEPEIALHPNWQRRYIFEFMNMVSKLDKNIHLILTSHSPFILSDLPKENVIFLDKGKQADVNIGTFGANIHTLLSHGFFMKDGLMGEFAKSKIEDVINYLNNKESTIKDNDEAQKLLNIIGEPIIKNQLQKMLDSKRLSKVDEIDKIKSDMKNLAKRLEELEK